MENIKYYIVSFSDSKHYLLKSVGDEGIQRLTRIENALNDYLKEQFPTETFTYYTTPRLTEISAEHLDRYSDYPKLDDDAIENIKELLKREVVNRDDTRELNDNAPQNDVPAEPMP